VNIDVIFGMPELDYLSLDTIHSGVRFFIFDDVICDVVDDVIERYRNVYDEPSDKNNVFYDFLTYLWRIANELTSLSSFSS
jgi:hypothetical protein